MDAYVQQLLSRVDSDISYKLSRIRQATSLREVASNRRADIPSAISAIARSQPAVRRLANDAERKAESLVDAQLAQLQNLTGDAFEQRLLFLREREWVHLRGNFPNLVSRVDQAVRRLKLERQNNA
ncbi:hypothetical protein [Burkholderia cenocepacia]|uniref:hypothetical protein n=1 Tax=Burkholderia cenocepacia TaxID=95486 RepID=UPI000760D41A|nr:hypothetical protein [Burkholderia cenocepacia]KWU23360.1 hypothetical protein AS149_37450 [Burkholderia cenocepacia]